MNEFVFPQTLSDDPNFKREGGLTKLELTALLILVSSPHLMVRFAFDKAEEFLHEAEKRQSPDYEYAVPVRNFDSP